MEQIVILVGKTCTGKTVLSEYLAKNYEYDRIKTATTRPRRLEESPDAYYFFTKSNFDIYEREGAFLEVDFVDGHKYGSFKNDYFSFKQGGENKIVVLTPEGVYNAVEQIDKVKLLIVWLDPPEETILKYATSRGEPISKVRERLEAEKEIFDRFEHSALADQVFYQNETIEEMAGWIRLVCMERDIAFSRAEPTE